MPYVYSTLTCDHAYTEWNPPPHPTSPLRTIKHQIVIKGGANLPDDKLTTYKGYRTPVTEQQVEILMRNKVFQRHMKDGFIVVKADKDDPEAVAKKMMEAADASAPYTPRSAIFNKPGDETVKPLPDDKIGAKVTSAIRGLFR